MKILVLNSGSSSLKFQLINTNGWKRLYKGFIDGINLKLCHFEGKVKDQELYEKISIKNHKDAIIYGLDKLMRSKVIKDLKEISAIGHRVVHGGEKFVKATVINKKLIDAVKEFSDLAPLHNPPNLAGILACQKLLPKTPQVAIFDTAFHQTIPEKAYLYGLPYNWYKKYRIRRYGFHGISHKYVSEQAIKLLKKKNSKIITCHLGNGQSITSVKNGKSIDTSMGFTPLEGVPMGTRSGDFDPAIVFYLNQEKKIPLSKIEDAVIYQSGLKGVSNLSSDMRNIRKGVLEKNKNALRAYNLLTYKISKYIGSYIATLNGLDAIVFTAGLGVNAWYLRRDICKNFAFLGLKLDNSRNKENKLIVSSKDSKVKVFVIPTNEELQIAQETNNVLK